MGLEFPSEASVTWQGGGKEDEGDRNRRKEGSRRMEEGEEENGGRRGGEQKMRGVGEEYGGRGRRIEKQVRGDKENRGGRRMEEKNKSQWGINKQMKQACKHWSVYLLELCRYKGLSLDWTQLPPEGLT